MINNCHGELLVNHQKNKSVNLAITNS